MADILRVVNGLSRNRQYRDAALVIVLATVGIRASNVVALNWDDIDFANGCIRLERTKNGDWGRTVPLIPIAGTHLSLWRDRRRDRKTEYVFGSLRGKPGRLTRSGLLQVVKKSFAAAPYGIPDIGPHDLRHSFATHYMDANPQGAATLKEIGGWKSDTMVQRYSKQGRARRAQEDFRATSPWAK
jgi:integrase